MRTSHGEPAFPVVGEYSHIKYTGMSLRDYFAAKALVGMMSGKPITSERAVPSYAEQAYEIADAMLKARK